MTRRLIELSHPIYDGLVTYPGLPAPEITDHLTREASRAVYEPGTEFQIGRISMVANTGTYLDTPSHRYEGGDDLSSVGLDRIADLPGLVIRLPQGQRAIDRSMLGQNEVAGRAVLLATGWDRYFATSEYANGNHPYLTRDAAEFLVEGEVVLVGIDSLNIDDTTDMSRPAHSLLLGNGIPIVEHMRNLAALPDSGFRFHAAPPLVAGMGTFPVRAYAVID